MGLNSLRAGREFFKLQTLRARCHLENRCSIGRDGDGVALALIVANQQRAGFESARPACLSCNSVKKDMTEPTAKRQGRSTKTRHDHIDRHNDYLIVAQPGQHDHGPELTLVPRMCRSVTTTSTGMMTRGRTHSSPSRCHLRSRRLWMSESLSIDSP